MKRCKRVLKTIEQGDLHALSEKEEYFVKEHLQGCASCRRYVQINQLVSAVMRSWEIPEVSSSLVHQVTAATYGISQVVPWYQLWNQSKRVSLAAIVATAFACLLMVGGLSLPVDEPVSKDAMRRSLSMIHGPSMKLDEDSMAVKLLGLGVE